MQQFKIIILIISLNIAKCIDVTKPNVVFIVFDDFRPAISGFGDTLAYTPNIDKFMQKSFYFTRAYSQQALCAPSRNSMLTGRRPDTLHLYDFYNYWRTFAGNFTTLPQYFKENGYHTHSIGKIFHPGISSNFTDDYPLSWSERTFHPVTEVYMNSPVCPEHRKSQSLKANLICPVEVKMHPGKTLPDIESTREAKRFLNHHQNSTKPYFLAVGFHKPHIPLKFPKKYAKIFPKHLYNCSMCNRPQDMPLVSWNPYTDVRRRDDSQKLNISFPFGPIPQDFETAIRWAYYASVGYVDTLFGKLVKAIDLNRTIVILTGDHGWSLGEHSEWSKFSNFEVAVRVPLIIYSPEFVQTAAKSMKNIVELLDIFPTLVDLAHLPQIKKCDEIGEITCVQGKSLYDLLKTGHSEIHRTALSQYPRPGVEPTEYPNSDKPKLHQIKIMGYSMRTENYRYTLWAGFNPNNFTRDLEKIYGEELYDHRKDSAEMWNLAGNSRYEGIQKRLHDRLIQKISKNS